MLSNWNLIALYEDVFMEDDPQRTCFTDIGRLQLAMIQMGFIDEAIQPIELIKWSNCTPSLAVRAELRRRGL